jgi:hypothetical protein
MKYIYILFLSIFPALSHASCSSDAVNLGTTAYNQKVFNWRFYLHNYPDLLAAYGPTAQTNATAGEQLAQMHWTNWGICEGRFASEEMVPSDYLAMNSDVAAVFGQNYASAIYHYLNYGVSEGRHGRSCYNLPTSINMNVSQGIVAGQATYANGQVLQLNGNSAGIVQTNYCTPRNQNTTIQWISFDVSANNFFQNYYGQFNQGDGDHLGVILRESAVTYTPNYYNGRGVIFFGKNSTEFLGEYFSRDDQNFSGYSTQLIEAPSATLLGNGTYSNSNSTSPLNSYSPVYSQFSLKDGVVYSVVIQASQDGIATTIKDKNSNQTISTYWTENRPGTHSPTATGISFFALCSNLSCLNKNININYTNISSGWF